MSHHIEVESGKSVKLPTAGKYCDRDIMVTGYGSNEADLQAKYNEGKQAEYDAFWDGYQINGTRAWYPYAFGGTGWTKENFRPKYPMQPVGTTGCEGMFYYFARYKTYDNDMFDFAELSEQIDFSKCTRATNTFRNACVKNLYCDFSNCTQMSYTFDTDSGGWSDYITIKVSEKLTDCLYAFRYAAHLTELRFTEDSVLAASINFQWSTDLTKASAGNIMTTLSTTVTGKTVTFSKSAIDKAFETSSGANDGSTSAEWTTLVNARPSWTVVLA